VTEPLLQVSIRVPTELREQTIARLLELAPGGFEERDEPGAAVFLVYTDDAGGARLHETFSSVASDAVEPGWEDGWRAFHRPVRAGGLWIGPPWEDPTAGEPAVVIDPGRAFGTGAHPTTRLCADLLARLPRGSLVDVGCGSGVLAIAAVRLGFAPVAAIDVDAVAVEATRANAEANGALVDASVVDALHDPVPATDVAVANILLGPVEAVLGRLEAATVVTSGYLEGERPRHSGWRHAETAALEGWAADVFVRSA